MRWLKRIFFLVLLGLSFYAGWTAAIEITSERMVINFQHEKEEFERSAAGNYIWSNAVKIDPSSIKPTDTWFNAQFKLMDESWQRFILDVEHQTLPNWDMEGDVVQFDYLTWVDKLLEMTKAKDDLQLKAEKIAYLELRKESMKDLETYLRSAYADMAAYDRYVQKDSAFRKMTKDNPQILF